MARSLTRSPQTSSPRAFALLISSIVAVAGIALMLEQHTTIATNPLDFRAFYCAGSAVLDGADPKNAPLQLRRGEGGLLPALQPTPRGPSVN